MKELWEQATLPYNLPYSLGLAVVFAYWVLTLTLAASSDVLGGDGGGDADGGDGSTEGESAAGGGMMAVRRIANIGDVPLTIVLSVLQAMVWTSSLLANYYFNPGQALGRGIALAAFSFLPAIVLTKLLTQPLVPFMRKLKASGKVETVIGESGLVKSLSLNQTYGQVEVIRGGQPPALLNCRLPAGLPEVPRGSVVTVQAYDETTGQYLVHPLSPETSPTSVQPT